MYKYKYEVILCAYKFFARHSAQMHNWCGTGPVWTYPDQYPEGAHIVMQVGVKTKDEALEIAEKLWKACGRD